MNDKIPIELGKGIRTLRKLKGLTQEELGEKSGISYKFIKFSHQDIQLIRKVLRLLNRGFAKLE